MPHQARKNSPVFLWCNMDPLSGRPHFPRNLIRRDIHTLGCSGHVMGSAGRPDSLKILRKSLAFCPGIAHD